MAWCGSASWLLTIQPGYWRQRCASKKPLPVVFPILAALLELLPGQVARGDRSNPPSLAFLIGKAPSLAQVTRGALAQILRVRFDAVDVLRDLIAAHPLGPQSNGMPHLAVGTVSQRYSQ